MSDLTNLTQLWLDGNRITDVSPLVGLININSLNLKKQSVTKPSVKGPDVSVPTAKSADSSWVVPDAISDNGTYNQETGLVTWTGVHPPQSPSFTFKTNVSIGKINSEFSGKVIQPITETYAVDFDSRGGSEVAGQSVEYGKPAKKPGDPKRQGYVFRA